METKNIFPQLKTTDFIEANPNVVHVPLFSNLVICYVEDSGENQNYISDSRLAEMGLSQDELGRTAIENLNNMENTQKGLHVMDQGDGTKAIAYENYDSYDATRILLLFKEKLDFFINVLGDPFYVTIPCRDYLLAVPTGYEGKLGAYAKELFEGKPSPLTPEIIVFSKKKETFEDK